MRTRCSRRAWTAIVLAALLVLTLLPASGALADRDAVCAEVPSGAFDDVPATSLHADNIDCVASHRIAVGVGGGAYDPAGPVTRGQMATYLVNLVEVAGGAPLDVPTGPAPFADARGTTHETSIRIAADLRITSGRTASSYEPSSTVTRAQMATFVAQTIEAIGGQFAGRPAAAFSDDDGSVHEPRIDALAAAGIVRGVGSGRYDPGAPVSRAQMATYLVNAAAFLHAQGLWAAGGDDAAVPALVLVLRADDEHLDRLELRFDRAVQPTATPDGVTVRELDGETEVARATLAPDDEQPGGSRVVLVTDTELTAAAAYRLRVPEAVVQTADGTPNAPEDVPFVFVTVIADDGSTEVDDSGAGGDQPADADDGDAPVGDGDGDAPVGDGDGDAPVGDGDGDEPVGDGDEPVDGGGGDESEGDDVGDEPVIAGPTITSIVTAPTDDMIVVTFSEEVSCPDTAAARAAWSFTNQSIIESGLDQAGGAPESVVGLGPVRPEACGLGYAKIENGDFGTLSYTSPSGETEQVRNTAEVGLASSSGLTVEDGVAPMLVLALAAGGDPAIVIQFSEPVHCESLETTSFDVTYDGDPQSYQADGIACLSPASSIVELTMDAAPAAGASVTVSVPLDARVTDESQVNLVVSTHSEVSTVASG